MPDYALVAIALVVLALLLGGEPFPNHTGAWMVACAAAVGVVGAGAVQSVRGRR